MEAEQIIDLDAPIANFGGAGRLTIRNLCEGCMITGGLGAGKTSGSFFFILKKMLMEGFGGLLLTVKPQEAEEYRRLCRQAGREKDLIEITPGGKHSFNWLEYESRTSDAGKPITDNILEVLKTCIKAGAQQDVGRGDDGFWQQSLDMLIGYVIDLCLLAYGKVSLDTVYKIVQSLPKMPTTAASSPKNDSDNGTFENAWQSAVMNVDAKRHDWHNSMATVPGFTTLTKSEYETRLYEAVPEVRTLDFVFEFFYQTFKYLNPKTRAIVEFIFIGFLAKLLREPVYSLFSKPSTVTPDDCYDGKIILINLPVKKYYETGRNIQLIVKLVCQRAWERRVITDSSMPLFLAADEAYTFVHEHDTLFQSTARSSRICTLAVTQNLNNYYSAMGGEKSEYKVKSLISTLATKIFHANTDVETNEYASALIGDSYFTDPSMNISMSTDSFTRGQNLGIKRERVYPPEFFNSLKCGGPNNNFNVEAIIHKQGDPISKGVNHARIVFKQQ